MTVREYIGARYVPLFMGDWDNTQTYEPLSIVDYMGDSYTSRQYVPRGIEITNEQYWCQSGNYSSQIEQYRQEVLALSAKLPSSAFDSTDTVKKYIDDHAQTPLNMVLIGDSWTDSNSATLQDNTNWVTYFKQWHPNAIIHNYAKGGSGFLVGTETYSVQLENAAADTSFNHDQVTHVLIIGGVNDFRNSQTMNDYTSEIRACISTVKTEFPNARLVFFQASCDRPDSYTIPSEATWISQNKFNHEFKRYVQTAHNQFDYECYIIAPIFPVAAFIAQGQANYARHLSKYGHRLLCMAIEYCLTNRREPLGVAQINNEYTDTTSGIKISKLRIMYNCDVWKLHAEINIPADISSTDNIYIALPDSAFYQPSNTYMFAGTMMDALPTLETYGKEMQTGIYQFGRNTLFPVMVNRGNIANVRSDFVAYLAYGFQQYRHGIILRCPNASTDNIKAGNYVLDMEFENYEQFLDSLFIYQCVK